MSKDRPGKPKARTLTYSTSGIIESRIRQGYHDMRKGTENEETDFLALILMPMVE